MKIFKIILIVLGALAFLTGVLWMGQGTGFIRWPANSFMIDLSEWTIRGAALAVTGLVAILIARRLG